MLRFKLLNLSLYAYKQRFRSVDLNQIKSLQFVLYLIVMNANKCLTGYSPCATRSRVTFSDLHEYLPPFITVLRSLAAKPQLNRLLFAYAKDKQLWNLSIATHMLPTQ